MEKHRVAVVLSFVMGIILAIVLGTVYFSYVFNQKEVERPIHQSIKIERKVPPAQQQSTLITSVPSHSLNTIKSNQWYSNLYKDFPSQPLYALPLVYKIKPSGIGISFPTIKKDEKAIFAPYTEDIEIGMRDTFRSVTITEVGDWHVKTRLKSQQAQMDAVLARGLPYTVITTDSQEGFVMRISADLQVYNNNKNLTTDKTSTSFVITTKKNSYIVVADSEGIIDQDKKTITIPAKRLFIAILPARDSYEKFNELSTIDIKGTETKMYVDENIVASKYSVATENKKPLVALLPHQYDTMTKKQPTLGVYDTIRGQMKLIESSSFVTTQPLIKPLTSFPSISKGSDEIRQQLKKDIEEFKKGKIPTSRGYFLGTWLGTATNLIMLADTYTLQAERDDLISYIKPVYRDSLKEFEYDEKQTSLIEKKPEFGNEKLNDHHFHYGYFIRTGAILSRFDTTLYEEIKPVINEMVGDIATTTRNSERYPYVRNFDWYEGHSWADGYANFNDGNNQESSSEAIHAWYSLYLWSIVSDNKDLETMALYLYNTEIQSTKYYWFGENNMYTKPYGYKIGSIIWGGKVDFTTWFSPETNMIYGIQLLPLTPGSMYLGTLKDFEKYEEDFLSQGGSYEKEWGELFLVLKSFYKPEEALKQKNTLTKFEDATAKSVVLYFLYYNSR